MKIGLDTGQEIINTIRQNKFRTLLTGFSIAWGIFMLIILLGSGNGLMNGFTSNFADMAVNSMRISTWRTSMPYEGMKSHRRISLDNKDMEITQKEFPDIIVKTAATLHQRNRTLSYGGEYVVTNLIGVHPDYTDIEAYSMAPGNGRFINEPDLKETRKIIVIHPKTAESLFKAESPIGKYINVNKIPYQVVGIYTPDQTSSSQQAFIPFTTAQLIYKKGKQVDQIYFTTTNLNTIEENEAFEKKYRKLIAANHQFNPEDRSAMWIWNRFTDYLQIQQAKNVLNIAIWIIGFFTLVSGIVGISNIMLITVKERTKEFGIRKALGASPASILWLIILESVFITTIFGYIGMVCGIGITEWAATYFEVQPKDGVVDELTFNIFKDPTVNLKVAIQATVVLIVSGVIAGFFPARKAVRIKPIEALKAD